jgi:hypothetical protein
MATISIKTKLASTDERPLNHRVAVGRLICDANVMDRQGTLHSHWRMLLNASGRNCVVRVFGRITMSFLRFTPALAAMILVSGPALAVPGNSMASAAAAKPTRPTHATAAKPVTAAKPAAKTAMIATPRHAASTPAGRMVTTKTTTGKTITYNCSLPGNASKKACK